MATMTRQLQLDNGEEEEDPEDLYGEEQRQLYNGFGGKCKMGFPFTILAFNK